MEKTSAGRKITVLDCERDVKIANFSTLHVSKHLSLRPGTEALFML